MNLYRIEDNGTKTFVVAPVAEAAVEAWRASKSKEPHGLLWEPEHVFFVQNEVLVWGSFGIQKDLEREYRERFELAYGK